MAEEELLAGDICVLLKAAMGMPALFLQVRVMEVIVTNIFYILC